MAKFFRNARIYTDAGFVTRNVKFGEEGLFFTDTLSPSDEVIENCLIMPGFADVHVHLREPGFSYKETILTGTKAAARGGYTTVCPMPNLNPVPDSLETLFRQLEKIRKDARIQVIPYGAITKGEQGEELSDMENMAPYVCAFSDDGRGVQSARMMESAMQEAKRLGKTICAHCEVNDLLHGGYIHDGRYAAAHGHAGICSASEYEQIARDVELSEKTGCAYHVCHISTKESVEIIRKAKARGINVTCETGPHYLLLCEDDLQEDGRFKMNPPLRSKEDQQALIAGILDGTIDMIATDHAPHSAEEKAKGLKGSAMGIVGLETAFALLYTHLVLPGTISLERLMELMVLNPRNRFGLPCTYPGVENVVSICDIGLKILADDPKEELADDLREKSNNHMEQSGVYGDFTVFETGGDYKIDPEEFLSMGRATPFAGWQVKAKCVLTVCKGKIAYQS